MTVKTAFLPQDFVQILAQYALGTYLRADPVAAGTVQTNYLLHTTEGQFVFRCYENRSLESVLFEMHLLVYLKQHGYPCPAPFQTRQGAWVGFHHNKPYVLFEFMAGNQIDHPTALHQRQLIQKAAELHTLTSKYRPHYQQQRWNYTPALCRTLAQAVAAKIDTPTAYEKLAWVEQQLATLHLPRSLPKGICHCDFHESNVLFLEDRFAALLDFDDANYTFLLFDLVGLIEAWAWSYPADTLDMTQARPIVQAYMNYRPINRTEQRHLYDVYKLSILFDCVWFFGRGAASECYERRKIDFLNDLGRTKFFEAIFL
jgi:homoserine kinase type II